MTTITKQLKKRGYKLKDFASMMGITVAHCYNLSKLKNKRFTEKQLNVLNQYLGDEWQEIFNCKNN